jgi:hypothetical protein
MTGRTDISVTQETNGWFQVDVHCGGVSTSHRVEVPAGLAAKLEWDQASETELVRESFVFLLEREPPTSILSSFRLDVIGRYFPEYPAEISSRAHRG